MSARVVIDREASTPPAGGPEPAPPVDASERQAQLTRARRADFWRFALAVGSLSLRDSADGTDATATMWDSLVDGRADGRDEAGDAALDESRDSDPRAA